MRRSLTTFLLTCAYTLASTAIASAQSPSYPPPSPQASLAGAEGGTAFTGPDLIAPMVLGTVLLVLAIIVLGLARRRSRMFRGTT